jgi:AraC-like DNA-binding protein
MNKSESIEDLYKRKFGRIPESIYKEIGHFNVFRLDSFVGDKARPVPYKRRDYYKITLVNGDTNIHYADKVIPIQNQCLVFTNPLIPYKWEHTHSIRNGYFCIFNQAFFHHYGNLDQFAVFQPGGNHLFELSHEQFSQLGGLFERMLEEIDSDYIHKYDLLRTLVFEMLHFAMKMQPSERIDKQPINASQRISFFFLELLERQFPIDEAHQRMILRTASDFARHLSVHVNHLNRAVKETTQKTTTQIIMARILQESKILLKHSSWNISEIAYGLGFNEVTHFNNFFKKQVQLSPLKFRNS